MKNFQEWKHTKALNRICESVGADAEIDSIRAVFDQLREKVSRSSESAGIGGTMKRGLFGLAKGAANLFGGKKAAEAIPDTKNNYDLNRTGLFDTMGKFASGAVDDIQDSNARKAAERRASGRVRGYREETEKEENLLLEWDRDALKVIMAAIDDAEKEVMHKFASLKSGARPGPNGSFETDGPRGKPGEFAMGSHTFQPDLDKFIAQHSTEMPAKALEKIEVAFETDPILAKFIKAVGRRHAKSAIADIAAEEGTTAEELANKLDRKYAAEGSLAAILMGKAVRKDVLSSLGKYGSRIEGPTGEKLPIGGTFDA
jgi:hypothetical protein